MRISGVEVRHFLGFKSLNIDFDRSFQVVAGANNAGKSSLIRVLEAFFAEPDGATLLDLLPRNEYYNGMGARTSSEVSVWFGDFSASETQKYSKYIRQATDGLMWVKVRCTRGGKLSFKASQDPSADEAHTLYQDVVSNFQFVKIPSIRVGGSGEGGDSMERLIDTLEAVLIRSGNHRSTNVQMEFASAMAPVEELVQRVLDESARAIEPDLPFREESVSFQLPSERHALRGMLDSMVIQSGGSVAVPVAERGTGFQSSLVLGILRYVAAQESQLDGNIMFAVEEPEAFLHPQTQRAMAKILRSVSADAQLLVTTHSSVLVDSVPISQVLRLPLMPDGVTYTWPLPSLDATTEGRLTRYCSAANSELIFANAVVFVEGEADKYAIDVLLERICNFPGGHYALGLTVIEAGGLGKIKYLVELAELFGVKSYVLSDKDSVLKTKSTNRVLLDVLSPRPAPMDGAARESLRIDADKPSSTLKDALKHQASINQHLASQNAFVMSSDLEGLIVDTLGATRVIQLLGPEGEAHLDQAYIDELAGLSAAATTLALSSKLGSKGWNATQKPSGKLPPHLVDSLIGEAYSVGASRQVLKPLLTWLSNIIAQASPTPL